MGAAAVRTVTIDEYLSNPAYRHAEWINGEVVELNVGTGQHGYIQLEIGFSLKSYLKQNPIGFAYGELHCRLRIGTQIRYRIPDVCVVLDDRVQGYLDRAPNLCVEIRSPDDSISDQLAKFADYFANGCQLGWLILPEEQSVLVLAPGSPSPRVARSADSLDGGNILPGLEIPVHSLFVQYAARYRPLLISSAWGLGIRNLRPRPRM